MNIEEGTMCRICHNDENTEADRLFSPCLCNGTMRYVHVECLRSWRVLSQNPQSFYKCDQCKYEYKIKRIEAYIWLQYWILRQCLTICVLFGLLFIGGFVNIDNINGRDSIAHFIRGSIVVGLSGFFGGIVKLYVFTNSLCWGNPFKSWYTPLGNSNSNSNKKNSEKDLFIVAVSIGLIVALVQIYKTVEWGCAKLLSRTGTEILEVRNR
jgi:hypothetical protein